MKVTERVTDATYQGTGTDRLDCSPGRMVRDCQQETLVQQCNDKKLGEFSVRHRRGL